MGEDYQGPRRAEMLAKNRENKQPQKSKIVNQKVSSKTLKLRTAVSGVPRDDSVASHTALSCCAWLTLFGMSAQAMALLKANIGSL